MLLVVFFFQLLVSIAVCLWCLGLTYGLLAALYHNREANKLECDPIFVLGPIFSPWIFSGIFAGTLSLLVIFYGLIAKLALKMARDTRQVRVGTAGGWATEPGLSGTDSRSANLRSKLKALKAPVVVAGAFCLCWLPHPFVYILTTLQVGTRRILCSIQVGSPLVSLWYVF